MSSAVTGLLSAASTGLSAYVTYVSKPGSSLFSYHPTAMTFAYGVAMTQAVSSLRPEYKPIADKLKISSRIQLHKYVNFAATASALIGLYVIWRNKELNAKPHFGSFHGKLGVTAVVGTVIQQLLGLLLDYPDLAWLRRIVSLKVHKMLHHASGLIVYNLAGYAMFEGLRSQFFKNAHKTNPNVQIACLAVCAGVWVLNDAMMLRTFSTRIKRWTSSGPSAKDQ